MAFFSRRKREDSQPERSREGAAEPAESTDAPTTDTDVTSGAQTDDAAADAAAQEAAASVNISMSSFRGLGGGPSAAARPSKPSGNDAPGNAKPAPSAAAPSGPVRAESIPGVRDNVPVREAIAKLADTAPADGLLEVARQLLQGHLFLRVKGDARTLLSEGKSLPLAVTKIGEKQFVLAYSSGAALQKSLAADNDTQTSAVGQPVTAVLKYVLGGAYAGLIIDPASAPARAVVPRELIEKMLDQADEKLTVKTLLSTPRTDATPEAVVAAIPDARLWVAVGKAPDGEKMGIAQGRADDGTRYLEVFTHPLEVAAMKRSDQPAPVTAAQLAGALKADPEIGGVVIDPGGPWIRLTRDQLAPVIALA
ncbi:MAG: histidine kinase [Microbacterium sp.]|uniref:SseB family protein n=1 Tax=unclassified Microbacterium TaxID=2609290 RepID=UPI000C4C1E89|nr:MULTISPECIES: SseB family protein [unclassified Microbacterium]MAY50076.1 histidine kinase [Microbacterium sp.]HBS73346.1 histidine kinase [Microbacterium sp.]|tara:strand:- start:128668 stop:129765 length:1098 start_codon:yes stop_codon:yes gene_type:complete